MSEGEQRVDMACGRHLVRGIQAALSSVGKMQKFSQLGSKQPHAATCNASSEFGDRVEKMVTTSNIRCLGSLPDVPFLDNLELTVILFPSNSTILFAYPLKHFFFNYYVNIKIVRKWSKSSVKLSSLARAIISNRWAKNPSAADTDDESLLRLLRIFSQKKKANRVRRARVERGVDDSPIATKPIINQSVFGSARCLSPPVTRSNLRIRHTSSLITAQQSSSQLSKFEVLSPRNWKDRSTSLFEG